MEDVLSKIALTGATFVGKAAWSYAASLALKKISASVQEHKENPVSDKELELLDKRLSKKLQIVTPIIDMCELLVAQGHSGLDNVLLLTDELKDHLLRFSSEMYRNDPEHNLQQLKELILELDDLIPLLQLVMITTQQPAVPTSDSISYSRLIQASSALVTGDSMVSFSDKQSSITVGPMFYVRLYTLFEGSARKSSVDWTWKEEFTKSIVTMQRSCSSRDYTLKITQDLNDGRYHDEEEVAQVRFISVSDISKMFYTSSGKLLNIQESLLPVLVLKVTQKDETKTETPVKARPEWVALELYRDTLDDSDSESEVTEGFERLELPSAPSTPARGVNRLNEKVGTHVRTKPGKGPTDTPTRTDTSKPEDIEEYSLSHLCLLEYILRLCSLEIRESKPHTKISDELLLHCLANTKRVHYDVSKTQRAPASPVAKPRLMDRFLSG